jgi:hypothetical protein
MAAGVTDEALLWEIGGIVALSRSGGSREAVVRGIYRKRAIG